MRLRAFALFSFVMLVASGTSAQISAHTDSSAVVKLDALIEEALVRNPGLKAAKSQWRASLAVVPQAGALPDPVLSFNLLNLPVTSFAFDLEPMTGKQVALRQMIPFPGKLGLRTEIADRKARAAKARYEELRNQLIRQVKEAYYDLYYVDRAIEVMRRNEELLGQFVKIARSKYEVGKGLQQDVLKAEVERSKILDKLIALKQRREAVEARLNDLLNRPPEEPVGRTEKLDLHPLSIDDIDSLKRLADENRPLFRLWRETVSAQEAQVRLARKEYFPDFSLGVAYTQREVLRSGMGGTDYFSAMASINIPLYFWRKQRMKVQENELRLASTEATFEDVRSTVYAKIEDALSNVEKNWRLLDLYRTGIIPQASQALNSALVAYQVDKVDFLTLLHSQVTLFNYELDYERVKRDYLKGIAMLEWLVGKSLP